MKKFRDTIYRASQTDVFESHWAVNTLDTNNPFLLRGCNLNDLIDKVIKSLFVTTNIIKT